MIKKTLSYGSWPSPITPTSLTEKKRRIMELASDEDRFVYLASSKERGTELLDDANQVLLSEEFTPQSRVHEYGGGSLTTYRDTLLFSRKEDGGVYLAKKGEAPTLIFKEEGLRFASFAIHKSLKWAVCVCEDHTTPEITNTLVLLNLETPGNKVLLHKGYDFYANPSFSPVDDGLAFIAWNNPYMPWDETSMILMDLGSREEIKTFSEEGSCFSEPRFAPKGELVFTSNSSGFAQLMCYKGGQVETLTDERGDFSTPLWVFHLSRFDFLDDHTIAAIITKKAIDTLMIIDMKDKTCQPLPLPFTDYNQIKCSHGSIYTVAASATSEASLIRIHPGQEVFTELLPSSSLASDLISIPEPITVPTNSGSVFAFFYPPNSSEYVGPKKEKPPLIVKVHSGPTSHSKPSLSLDVQFWTSRGFAFMEVNYRGSSGYGKAYQNALYGHWGDFDVQDTVAATKFVTEKGFVDPDKVIIKGSSAGGLTALMSLATSELFSLGIIYYGITDLEAMMHHTDHKFEAHYNTQLIGKDVETIRARSPLCQLSHIQSPLLFFQGGKDLVVPASGTKAMVEALKKQGARVALGFFPEEGHGFRLPSTKELCFEAESYFISQTLSINVTENKKSDQIDWND